MTPEPANRGSSDIMQFADLGLRLAASVALAAFAGLKLDQWFDTTPWLLIVCSLVGVVAGMVSTIRGVNRWLAAAKLRKAPASSESSPESPDSSRERPDEPS